MVTVKKKVIGNCIGTFKIRDNSPVYRRQWQDKQVNDELCFA